MTLAIETRQLTRYFDGFCAVNAIDLRVEAGTFYGFLGPNGAGKSTTIKMLTGLLAPSQGQILVLGKNMLDPREALEVKARVGVIPEDLALFDNLTAREYLTFVGRMYLLPRDTIRSRIDELLPLLGLEKEEKKLTLEYSHGMKKKLALAAALIANPDLLFLDEPFEGVDAVTSRVIRDLLAGFVARGSTVFLTSHVLEIVEKLCTHVGIIVKGQLVEQASLETIRQGGSLEDRFLERAGADAEVDAQAQLAGGEHAVNWQHFQTFVWLRWRLFRQPVAPRRHRQRHHSDDPGRRRPRPRRRACRSPFSWSACSYCPIQPDALPATLLYVWDGLVLAFVFFWTIGLMVELQRSEVLSLDKFLHLPVSLKSAFLINYLSSLFSVTLILFVPAMIALSLALTLTVRPTMVVLLPLLAAFILMVTALTYQFQGWLAALMVNKRRRRTVIVFVTAAFILICQLPNLVSILHPWKREQENELVQDQRKDEADLEQAYAANKMSASEYQRQQLEIQRRYQTRAEELEQQKLQRFTGTARLINMIVPLGWLPLGAMDAAEGHLVSALLGTLGMTAIGAASLWRSYRTTLRLYTGYYTSGKREPVAVVAPVKSAAPTPLLLEKQIPWLSEPTAAVALGSFRSLMRAPETKMILLSPLMMVLVFGSLSLAHTMNPDETMKPMMAFGAMSMTMFSLIQLVGNQFGFDRAGFRVYVLSAAPRRDILLGKNLSTAPVAFAMGLTMIVFLQVIYPMRLDYFLATLPQLLSTYLLFCMLANWLSILAPTAVRSGTFRAANPKGITLLLQFMFLFLFPVVLTPILFPLAIEKVLERFGGIQGVPICLMLSVVECVAIIGLYRVVLAWQGYVLQAREQKILEIVTTKTE